MMMLIDLQCIISNSKCGVLHMLCILCHVTHVSLAFKSSLMFYV